MGFWTNSLTETKSRNRILVGLITLVILLCFLFQYYKQYSIVHNEEKTTGEIIEFFHINKARYAIKYQYVVNKEKYWGQTGVHVFECDNGKKGCVGKEFPVYYSSKNPGYSKIDLGKYEKHKTTVEFIK